MKAMLFAAGLGTRLRPLTNNRPKALVEINGEPMLAIVIRRLKQAGVREMVINVHHFAEKIMQYVEKQHFFGIDIFFSHEKDQVLETGGGLKKVVSFFDDGSPFFVHNTDIISTIDLKALYAYHQSNNAIATLATRNRNTSRYLLFHQDTNELWGWQNVKTEETRWSRRQSIIFKKQAFSGIHVIDPRLFQFFSEEAKFSIIDTYLQAAKTERILAYPHDKDTWLDVGKPEMLEKAKVLIEENKGLFA